MGIMLYLAFGILSKVFLSSDNEGSNFLAEDENDLDRPKNCNECFCSEKSLNGRLNGTGCCFETPVFGYCDGKWCCCNDLEYCRKNPSCCVAETDCCLWTPI